MTFDLLTHFRKASKYNMKQVSQGTTLQLSEQVARISKLFSDELELMI